MGKLKWAILLLVIILLAASSSTVVSAQKTQGTVTIVSPPKNGKIGPTESVSGKAQLSKGYTLWIIPYDGTAGKYYPQGSPVAVRNDASWSSRLSLGNAIGVGKKFQIQAIVADKLANSVLSNYVRKGQQTGTALPYGAQAVNAITVTRVATNAAVVTPLPHPSPSKVISSKTTSATPRTLPITTPSQAAPISTNTATSSVTQASAGAAPSRNPLPGFEGIYALSALAAVFVLLQKRRRR